MPHVALIVDLNPTTREAFGQRAMKILRDTFGLTAQHLDGGGASVVYVPCPFARSSSKTNTLRYDAFGSEFAISIEVTNGALTLRTDLLGHYPLFYCRDGATLICASSPSLFTAHAGFRPVLDEVGLAMCLMIMHTACGRTLWRGVRRLPAATDLHFSQGEVIEKAREWPSVALEEKDWTTLRREIDDYFIDFVTQCGEMPTLMLSGGIDSRIVAGYLQKAGKKARALSFGDPTDSEGQIARRVAHACGLEHDLVRVDLNRYPEWAQRQIDMWHITTGVTDFAGCRLSDLKFPGSIISGYLGDSVLGGSHLEWAWNPATGEFTFDQFWRKLRAYGLPDETVRRLLRVANADEAMAEAKALCRQEYDNYPGYNFQKTWRFDIHNRQRYHIGRVFWRMALATHPRVPYAGERLLSICGRMPLHQIRRRAVEVRLMEEEFTHLARLPLDRNSFDTRPMVMSRPIRLWWKARSRIASRWRRWTGQTGIETRYYYRHYNFSTNPGWQAIREQGLAVADEVSDVFDPSVVRELIPAPPAPLPVRDEIIDTSGHKTLCCLLLWAKKYAH